jgi:hypothetical protein
MTWAASIEDGPPESAQRQAAELMGAYFGPMQALVDAVARVWEELAAAEDGNENQVIVDLVCALLEFAAGLADSAPDGSAEAVRRVALKIAGSTARWSR